MNRRTTFLLIGAALVATLYFGDSLYRSYVERPAASREKNLKKIENAIENANELIAQKLSVQKQLDAYEKMALPLNTDVARTSYRGWLLSELKSVGLTGISVDATEPTAISIKRQQPKRNQAARKTVMHRYRYSLRCRGSLQQLVSFLFVFYRSGHLHKIRSIALNPSAGGSLIETSMSIEALSLVRTEREMELTTVSVNRLKNDDELHYISIARRNIFSKTGDSVLNNVRVTAITFGKSGRPQVWIKLKPGQPSMVFHNDEKFDVRSHQVEVLDIQTDIVLVLVDGLPTKVALGNAIIEKTESLKPEESKAVASKDQKTVD